MSGRIVLLSSSPRVAPGLLSWPAWEVLRSPGSRVYVAGHDHPQLPALRDANVAVHVTNDTDPAAVADELLAAVGDGAVEAAVRLSPPEGDPGVGEELARRVAGFDDPPELELLPAAYDLPGAHLIDLVRVMDRLRRECPWVRGQTHRSLVRYLVEEAYETVEALESGDRTHLREELGDLLFQVVFHARLAEEYPSAGGEHREDDGPGAAVPAGDAPPADDPSGPWSIDDVAAGLSEKLIRRNPHVFATADGTGRAEADRAGAAEEGTLTPDEIENVWDQLKSEEKGRASVFEGVPPGLPALAMADKVLQRAEQAGRELPDPPRNGGDRGDADPAGQTDRAGQTGRAGRVDGAGRVHDVGQDLGDRLLALVREGRRAGVDPEQALRDALRRRLPPRP